MTPSPAALTDTVNTPSPDHLPAPDVSECVTSGTPGNRGCFLDINQCIIITYHYISSLYNRVLGWRGRGNTPLSSSSCSMFLQERRRYFPRFHATDHGHKLCAGPTTVPGFDVWGHSRRCVAMFDEADHEVLYTNIWTVCNQMTVYGN